MIEQPDELSEGKHRLTQQRNVWSVALTALENKELIIASDII